MTQPTAAPPNPYDFLPEVPTFTLGSNDVADGQTLTQPFLSGVLGAGGEDRSPHLSWEGFPAQTRSFAVTCFDPDAPTAAGFWHWAVFDIPTDITELASGAGDAGGSGLPDGAITLPASSGHAQYVGASPPPQHREHRYMFVVHAVDVETLEVGPGSSPTVLGFNLYFHTLARAYLTPVYENKG
ncbi:MAG: YbhB/YbcL family Raf kinase inhibitor-like protein [Thermocrispum sp.]